MKNLLLLLSVLCLCCFACEKADLSPLSKDSFDKDKEEISCVIGDCPTCDNNAYSDPNNVDEGVQVFILEPLELDADCGCVKSGYVKYLKNSVTVALVKYDDGDCQGKAYRTNCVNGDCYHESATTCVIDISCDN